MTNSILHIMPDEHQRSIRNTIPEFVEFLDREMYDKTIGRRTPKTIASIEELAIDIRRDDDVALKMHFFEFFGIELEDLEDMVANDRLFADRLDYFMVHWPDIDPDK